MDIVTRKASHLHASTWPDVVGHQGFLQGGKVCVCVCVRVRVRWMHGGESMRYFTSGRNLGLMVPLTTTPLFALKHLVYFKHRPGAVQEIESNLLDIQ